MNTHPHSTRAIVAHQPASEHVNWQMESLTLRAIREDELLIEIIATGICHTDIALSLSPPERGQYPRVLGHEGAGYVRAVGPQVRAAKLGDPVLLSFASCGRCENCSNRLPSYCDHWLQLNPRGEKDVFQAEEGARGGLFFGQSSFANWGLAREASVVNVSGLVRDREDLMLFAPLGCGIMTGAGVVTQVAGVEEKDSLVVLGLGSVGLAAVMAAKIKGLKTIIGVDRVSGRLELAKDLGVTHTLDTSSDLDLVKEIQGISQGKGVSFVIDTTGNLGIMTQGLNVLAKRGGMILVGLPSSGNELAISIPEFLMTGRSIRGTVHGDVVSHEYIREMIRWYRDGKLPFDKFVKYYPAADFAKALTDMESGVTVKPVLVW